MPRTIWQYWETKGDKPAFVDGLFELARRNSGVEVVRVTPSTLSSYVSDIPQQILDIDELAHKADMIRALLIREHGGMWLDSDAIVLRDLNWLFDLLDGYEFVGFNDSGRLTADDLQIRVNCFLARSGSHVVSHWVEAQHAKFPRTTYAWTEIGTDLLGPLCLQNAERVKVLPFRMVCPIPWDQVERFTKGASEVDQLLHDVHVVMLSNKALERGNPDVRRRTVEEMSAANDLLGAIVRAAQGAH
jgi:hypothetical protein